MFKTLPLLLILASCWHEPRLDTSTEKAFQESARTIEKTLKDEELALFQHNVQTIKNSEQDKKRVNGKTAKELQAEIYRMGDEEYLENLEEAIQELSEKKNLSDKINEEFKNLVIIKSVIKDRDGSEISVTFKNTTTHTITAITFKALISAPHRKTIWTDQEFTISIPQGIEVGENHSFDYTTPPNNIHWRKGIIPKEYSLKLSPVGAWDHEGKKFFPGSFNAKDQDDLENFPKELITLRKEMKTKHYLELATKKRK